MPLHTVELRPDRTAEITPEAASQVFSSLSSLRSSFLNRIFGTEEPIVFEIISLDQKTHFYAHFPDPLAAYIESQIAAQYPKASVVAAPDPLPEKIAGKFTVVGELKLSGPNYLPLKTWREFTDSDPMSSVLGTMAKVDVEDTLLVQVIVLPTGSGWRRAGARAVSQGVIDSEGNKKAHPKAALIDKKITQNGFRVGIRLLAASSDEKKAKQLISSLAGSFGSLTLGESNSLIYAKPAFWQQNAFLQSILARGPKFVPGGQFLTVDELATVFHLPSVNLSEIKNVTWGGSLLGDPPDSLPTGVGVSDEERAQINFFAKTEFRNQLTNFGIKRIDRRRHVYIVGKSGTGKSTLIANMAINDMFNGEGLAVVDPHGDLSEIILDYVPAFRINDVAYLDAAGASKRPFRMNLFEVKNPEQGELVASGIVSIFQKLYGYSWGPRLEYILRNCILTLILRPNSTLVDVPRILTDKGFRKSVVAGLDDIVLKNFWENEFEKMNDKLQTEAISPILNKVGQFVSSPTVREIIGYPVSTIDMEDAMNSGKIVILNLSQGRLGEDNAALLGAMIITKIQLAAMNRAAISEEERRDFYLYVDEFQNFATHSFIKILSEARKYRLNLTVANQYISQVIEEVQHAIFGNVGTLMSFLVSAQDAQILTREFGQVYKEEDMVGLDNYQIITKLAIDGKTSRPFFAYTLPLPQNKTDNREQVIFASEEKYTKIAGEGAYVPVSVDSPPSDLTPLPPQQAQVEGKKKRKRRKHGEGGDGPRPQSPNVNDVWRPETGRQVPVFGNPQTDRQSAVGAHPSSEGSSKETVYEG
ncbi:MAG: TraM recognition domain-containing protein [Patescibacteria group bacterium]